MRVLMSPERGMGMKMHNTTTGVAITAGDSWENADFIVLNLTGDARVFLRE